MNAPIEVIDSSKSAQLCSDLLTFFESNPREIEVCKGYQKVKSGVLADTHETFLQQLKKTLESLGSLGGNQDIQIYRVWKKGSLTFEVDSAALMRLVLVIGDPAFLEMPMPHSGRSTGRAPTRVHLLASGNSYMVRPDQKVSILGDVSRDIFFKGEGKKKVTKPSNFTQFVIYYTLAFDSSEMKKLQNLLTTGKLDTLFSEKNIQGLFESKEDLDGMEDFLA